LSSLVILAASMFEISCRKTDRHTDKGSKNPTPATDFEVSNHYGIRYGESVVGPNLLIFSTT